MNINEKYAIYVAQKRVFAEEARVSKMPFNRHWPGYQRPLDQTLISGFVSFDITGRTELKIECNFDFENVEVRPYSLGIKVEKEGKTVTFYLEKACQAVVEFDGMQEVLHIFANPPEEKPELSDNDLYFGPGEHDVGRIIPENGQTIYIDKDAVVYGEIYAMDVENVTVAGRGILDHSKIQPEQEEDKTTIDPVRPSPILFQYCKNITIKDIIVRDPCFLAVRPIACEDLLIDNIKVIGCWRYNSDGIDLINTRRGIIKNCFVRSFDDSICLKGFYFLYQGEMFHNHNTYDTMEDIVIENCVVWNDWGKSLHIGVDLCAKEIKNCIFRNCDIIHATSSMLDVSNVDYAEVFDILYENIRVEYDSVTQPPKIQESDKDEYVFNPESTYMPELFAIYIVKTQYSFGGTKRGKIYNIKFKDISITAPKMPPSGINGYSSEFSVDGVTFENISLNGKKITFLDDMNIKINDYAKNISLK